ncbi:MAG TPA: hypothetical protein VG167_06325 [Verrucomicrobiae bacterium]|nr:hypothetical protein [Verrucomicrobiae bacterium]
MSGRYKVILGVAVAAMMMAGFAKSDLQSVEAGRAAQSGSSLMAADEEADLFDDLRLAVKQKGRESIRALPSAGATLAAMTLVVPFAFSTYRSLRRRG